MLHFRLEALWVLCLASIALKEADGLKCVKCVGTGGAGQCFDSFPQPSRCLLSSYCTTTTVYANGEPRSVARTCSPVSLNTCHSDWAGLRKTCVVSCDQDGCNSEVTQALSAADETHANGNDTARGFVDSVVSAVKFVSDLV